MEYFSTAKNVFCEKKLRQGLQAKSLPTPAACSHKRNLFHYNLAALMHIDTRLARLVAQANAL